MSNEGSGRIRRRKRNEEEGEKMRVWVLEKDDDL